MFVVLYKETSLNYVIIKIEVTNEVTRKNLFLNSIKKFVM